MLLFNKKKYQNLKNVNLVKTVCDRLVYIINYKKDEHKGKSVLAIVIKIAQDDDDNHKREIAMRLL
jgi:hypothetical protein